MPNAPAEAGGLREALETSSLKLDVFFSSGSEAERTERSESEWEGVWGGERSGSLAGFERGRERGGLREALETSSLQAGRFFLERERR